MNSMILKKRMRVQTTRLLHVQDACSHSKCAGKVLKWHQMDNMKKAQGGIKSGKVKTEEHNHIVKDKF